jgi:hypothetical protein
MQSHVAACTLSIRVGSRDPEWLQTLDKRRQNLKDRRDKGVMREKLDSKRSPARSRRRCISQTQKSVGGWRRKPKKRRAVTDEGRRADRGFLMHEP